ncbi:MAG: HPr(Ser) kinase/phosphatase [Treponema sp.]
MITKKKTFQVYQLLESQVKEYDELELKCLAGRKGLFNEIKTANVNRPGLALAGFVQDFSHERIQLLGKGEYNYLKKMKEDERNGVVEKGNTTYLIRQFLSHSIPACVFSNSFMPDQDFLDIAEELNCPILQTKLSSSEFTIRFLRILYDQFAESVGMHGNLIDVFGIGIFITGASGIGKSEITLELVDRGHKLVGDDLINISRLNESTLVGRAGNKKFSHKLAIRGIGLVDIRQFYGITAVKETKQIQLIAHLEEWNTDKIYDALDFKEKTQNILGVELPRLEIPVKYGRNVAIIIEMAAKKEKLKMMSNSIETNFIQDVLQIGKSIGDDYYNDSY